MDTNSAFILSTSWNALRHVNGRDIVNEIKSLGFGRIELSFNLTGEILEDIKGVYERREIEITSVHNFCPIPDTLDVEEALPDCYSISSADDEERSIAVKYTKRTIDTASLLGAQVAILHCGRVDIPDRTRVLASLYERNEGESARYRREKEVMLAEREAKKKPHLESLRKSLDELLRYARTCGVKLAMENRYYFGEIPSLEEIGTLLKDFPGLFYWHDVGHAQNLENLGFVKHEDYLARHKDSIIGFHLHNIAGTKDHLAPQSGEFDFSKLKPYLRQGQLWVIESHYPATGEQIRQGRIYLEKIFTGGVK